MNFSWLNLLILLVLTFTGCVEGDTITGKYQAGDWKNGFFDQIYTGEVLDVGLSFNKEKLLDKIDKSKGVKAKITIAIPTGVEKISARIAARGQSRKRICDFPPLHLNFSKKTHSKYDWIDFGKYKIVTHCLEEDTINRLTLSEYLIYQLYQTVSPYALKTQLCKIRYDSPTEDDIHFGFIIEDEDEMANRLGGSIAQGDLTKMQVNKEQYQKLVLFQYMIGNTDWNLSRSHNIAWVNIPGENHPVIIPYDFDASGLIDAPYATPHENLPIEGVRERFFQYRGSKEDDFSHVVKDFLSMENKIFDCVRQYTLLDDQNTNEIELYLRDFYILMKSPDWKDKVFRD